MDPVLSMLLCDLTEEYNRQYDVEQLTVGEFRRDIRPMEYEPKMYMKADGLAPESLYFPMLPKMFA